MAHFPWPFLVGGVALVLMGGLWPYREATSERSLDTEAATYQLTAISMNYSALLPPHA
jgi:hypothetical protein